MDKARDHPRMCGEHSVVALYSRTAGGSSPHVRGALRRISRWKLHRGDHPRMCGEHSGMNAKTSARTGSSPHVRGALVPGFVSGRVPGIIPACAGSTAILKSCRFGIRDHPRMCGEHKISNSLINNSQGSSPHVRGAHSCSPTYCQARGIIPACAGSTRELLGYHYQARDHPRMCGEHWSNKGELVFDPGSSPHVRGALRSGLR